MSQNGLSDPEKDITTLTPLVAANEMHWLPQGGVFCVMGYNDSYGFGGHLRFDPKFSSEKSAVEIFEFQKNFYTIGTARVQTIVNGREKIKTVT